MLRTAPERRAPYLGLAKNLGDWKEGAGTFMERFWHN